MLWSEMGEKLSDGADVCNPLRSMTGGRISSFTARDFVLSKKPRTRSVQRSWPGGRVRISQDVFHFTLLKLSDEGPEWRVDEILMSKTLAYDSNDP
jgi:hypothetical protein